MTKKMKVFIGSFSSSTAFGFAKALHQAFKGQVEFFEDDTGTRDKFLKAGSFVQTNEHRKGSKIINLEDMESGKNSLPPDGISKLIENPGPTAFGDVFRTVVVGA